MDKVKFALMGCGKIAKKHATALKELNNAVLAGVCDFNLERAKDLASEYNVPYFSNIQDLLNSIDVDAVTILTPSGYHAPHTLEVANFKKHVVVEKPMALTLDDADKMISACVENGVKLFVVKQNRFNYPVIKLREAITQNRFGRLVYGSVRVRWCRKQDYYDQDSWRGTWALDGGVFANQASHHIDLLEWMLGDVDTVFAKARTQLVNIEVEDTGIACLSFRNGALGMIEATTATRPIDIESSISILGEKGAVEIGGFAVNQIKVWNFVDKTSDDDAIVSEAAESPFNAYAYGHKAYLKNVAEAIILDKPGLVDGIVGRKSLRLISAIYESIETGYEVSLNFKPKKCKLGIG